MRTIPAAPPTAFKMFRPGVASGAGLELSEGNFPANARRDETRRATTSTVSTAKRIPTAVYELCPRDAAAAHIEVRAIKPVPRPTPIVSAAGDSRSTRPIPLATTTPKHKQTAPNTIAASIAPHARG